MKILQISEGIGRIYSNTTSPVELVIMNLAKNLTRIGHEVTILTKKSSKTDNDVDYIEGVRIVRLRTRSLTACKRSFLCLIVESFFFAIAVNSYLRKECFDIVHVHLPLTSCILATFNRKLRKKMVYTCHADEYRLGISPRIKPPFYLRLFPADLYLMQRVKKTVLLNTSIFQKLMSLKKIASEKILVIHNGVDTEKFAPHNDAEDTKQKFMISGKTVLYVGRISERKGLEYLIKAANIVVNVRGLKHVTFLLVGAVGGGFFARANPKSDPFFKHLFDLIEGYSLERNVRFTGFVSSEDLRKLYVASDIFVLPSLQEGFGLVLTQAMASGKPVIGTRTGGILEQIKDGYNGLLVEPADERRLAEKIYYLLINEKERAIMGHNGRKTAIERFSWGVIAEKYSAAYESILKER